MKLAIRVTANTKGVYTAMCPSLPGCMSQAPTQEEATVRLVEVVRGYLAAVSNFVPDDIQYEYSSEAAAKAGAGGSGTLRDPAGDKSGQ